ncbi:hypothetical protein Klosneuvirus_4_76 [Klosneuvirus KNV1]|uniref:Uncharacterized protein n=1 Tax=Klosneuvirus KNV1 TaxID=1977640 RepID=A0A1V0SKS0_9VIRU|nr:hypothetical protein Klosneuvirus_4_76 [Klosneuvirus KNV1]
MNITTRFNELFHNFNPIMTHVDDYQYNTDNYTLYITRIMHNIYGNLESYDRIVIRNKATEYCEAYYIDSKKDQNIYDMIMQKMNNVNQINIKKRKADCDIDMEYMFKKMKLSDDMVIENNSDEIIEDIHKKLKRKRFEDIEKDNCYESDDEGIEPINKKQKIES